MIRDLPVETQCHPEPDEVCGSLHSGQASGPFGRAHHASQPGVLTILCLFKELNIYFI